MERSKQRDAFEKFVEQAKERFGDSLKKLILYGSVAREEENEYSDIDIYAVVETEEQKRELEELAFECGLDYGVAFSPNVKTQSQFQERKDHPFTRSVMEEGESHA